MRPWIACLSFSALLMLSAGCGQKQSEEARAKAQERSEEARAEMHKLGSEMKQEAHLVKRKVNQALQPDTAQNSDEKLSAAGKEASTKLGNAAIIAKVKARLATDVGLNTVTDIGVDATGHVVTLRGTVSSPEKKKLAGDAVSQLDGVTKVVNNLQVQQ